MSSYGKNFEFRIGPDARQRDGRFAVPTTSSSGTTSGKLPIGIPVVADTVAGVNALGLQIVKVPAEATARTQNGGQGILVYEYGPAAYAGFDPFLTTWSDVAEVPLGAACQVVHGPNIKLLLKNTVASTFLNERSYPARTMVAGLGGATPTIAVGDFLVPGVGSDTSGWWEETSTASQAWLKVLEVDNARAECVCEVLV